jgi:hypothetical protein
VTKARALHAALWASGAFAAAYLLQGALHLPAVLYDPVARSVSVAAVPSGVQMRFYSDLAGASLVALAAAGASLLREGRRYDPLLLAGAALSLVALDAAFFFSRVLAAAR